MSARNHAGHRGQPAHPQAREPKDPFRRTYDVLCSYFVLKEHHGKYNRNRVDRRNVESRHGLHQNQCRLRPLLCRAVL